MLTATRLREVLEYCPNTGVFRWRVARKHCAVGAVAGRIDVHGYMRIGIDGQRYRAARLAWLYMTGEWPAADIDHVNCAKADDRWANLRAATRSENLGNCPLRRDNTTGFKGVTFDKQSGKYQAQIRFQHRSRTIGRFDTAEQAHAAYMAAATAAFGEFARAA